MSAARTPYQQDYLDAMLPPIERLQGASTAELRHASHRDAIGHSSVQPWSAGELFPCVIAQVERYAGPERGIAYSRPLVSRLLSKSFELIAYGRREEYATYADAAQVARALNADPDTRARWTRTGEDRARVAALLAGAA